MRFNIIESYGDCTNKYRISLDKEYTVGEFIDTILKERPKEHGYIAVLNIDACRYSNGELVNKGFEPEILSKNIKDIVSHGGWSLMDYTIYI